jgi:Fe-S-cluster formation regulator IscX/YfhJ
MLLMRKQISLMQSHTMKRISSKTIAIWLLLAAIAVLLYLLLSNSKEPDSHATDHAIVQADNKIILAQRDAGLRKIDSLEKDALKRGTLIDSLKKELSFSRRDLDKSTAKAVQLAQEIKQLKDTSAYGRRCDSLASEAINFAWLYEQYKAHSDSLSTVVDKNNEDYMRALEVRSKMYYDLYDKYEQLYTLYNILFKDHQQAGKKLRRQKLMTKVAALLGLVGAGVIIFK